MNMIEVKNLSKKYREATPLKNVSFKLDKGEIVAVLGPSGCGKSTLLRCINLLENPTSGEIILDGESILDSRISLTKIRRKIGMVFQNYQLYPQYTVLENVMMPERHILRMDKQQSYDNAINLLREVNLLSQKNSYPEELSGGQKQRVAFARTLAMNPDILLLDEPTSALDPAAVFEIRYIIKKLSEKGKTILLVTHDMSFARNTATRILFLNDGIICEDTTPDEFFQSPKSESGKHFLSQDDSLEFIVYDNNYNFLESISKITTFTENHGQNEKISERLISIFEEIVMIGLLPHINDTGAIRISLSIHNNDTITMSISYGGKVFDPLSLMDSSSISILRHQADEIAYKEIKSEANCNLIEIKVTI